MQSFKLVPHDVENKDNCLYSSLFEDIFQSTSGAMEQAEYVYVNGNNLKEKFRTTKAPLKIAELGFGTGVNFLTTFLTWKESGSSLPLFYTSIEGFPLDKEIIKNYLNELVLNSIQFTKHKEGALEIIEELYCKYPVLVRGVHSISLNHSKVFLTLHFHPVGYALENINYEFDAWYLDGFSPSKNKDMWSGEILKKIFKNTKPSGTFSTYSTSSVIKEAAKGAGFSTKKEEGFSRKKEMLVGIKETSPSIKSNFKKSLKKIAVIGGGLSGASLVYALKKRGLEVSLFEKEEACFLKASGNEKGVIMPQLSSKPDAQCRYFLAGYLHTLRLISSLEKEKTLESIKKGGVVRMCNVNKWESIYERLEEQGFNVLCNKIDIGTYKALDFLDAVAINPRELGERLLGENGNHELYLKSKVISILEKEDKVVIATNDFEREFDAVVFSGAFGSAFIETLSWIPIEKIKGELGIIKTPEKLSLRTICYDGYVVPLENNSTLIGATYEHNTHDEVPSFTTTKNLYQRLLNYQNLDQLEEKNYLGGRVCFRTTSPDRLPIVGPIDEDSKIYVSLGHGSRGLVSCPLSAELIAQMILNEPISIEQDLLKEILPIRYLERVVRREKSLENMYPASYLWREYAKEKVR